MPMRMRRLALLLLLLTLLPACQQQKTMPIAHRDFGRTDGRDVGVWTLVNEHGTSVSITNYGGIVTELHVADRDGEMADVVLGFDTLAEYVDHNPYFGAIVGRVGNRIANARFSMGEATFALAANNDPHHLHGGDKGWDKVVWDASPMETDDGPALQLSYFSPDGEEGYPGDVTATVVYTLTQDDVLRIDMTARTDRATPINMVHHSYWNLGGHDSRDVLGDELMLRAENYTPADETLIPTGAIAPVAGTPFDFRRAHPIRDDIHMLPATDTDPGGYDLNFVVDGPPGELRLAARVRDARSGRVMEVWTTEPGIQFYTGNFLAGIDGKDGARYEKNDGLCLETQKYPDSINKQGEEGWPSVIVRPGRTYRHIMEHRFSVD